MTYPSIALWGDSIGRGIDFDPVRGRYAVMKRHFAKLLEEKGLIAIDNHSRFGATVGEGLQDFEQTKDIGAGYLAIAFGGNDCNMPWDKVSQAPHMLYDAATPLPQFEQTLSRFAEAVRARGITPILVTPPPLMARRFVAWVSKGLDRSAIRKYLGDIQHVYRWQERYSVAVHRVARNLQCPLFDLRDAMLANPAYGALCGQDGMHINERGHAFIARAVEEALPRLFRGGESGD